MSQSGLHNGDEIRPGVYYWYGREVDAESLANLQSLENRERQWAKEAKSTKDVHEHVFSVPVEFENFNIGPAYDGNGHVTLVARNTRVTKLRCVCGEEVDRESNSNDDN
jgi:hypothetical protein